MEKKYFYIRYELCGVIKIENFLIWIKLVYFIIEINGNRNIYLF